MFGWRQKASDADEGEATRGGYYLDEARLLLAEVNARIESMNTRAGILIAAASISASIGALGQGRSAWVLFALLAGLVAAVLGVIALWPTKGGQTNFDVAREALLGQPPEQSLRRLGDSKRQQYNLRLKDLTRRAWLMRIGFLLLAVSIFASTLTVLDVRITIGWFQVGQ